MLSCLAISACGQSTNHPDQLKIGTLLPITGDLAAYGSSMQQSARLLVDRVNACGGVLGQPVELVAQDDQTEPAAGAAAMTRLAEVDRVAGVVGAASSAVSSAAVEIAVRNQVVMISPASTSPVFSDRARRGDFNGFWLRTAPPDTFQGEALAKLAKARGYQTVAVLVINNDYGNGLLSSFIPNFEALGGRVPNKANPARYAPDSSTFDSVVSAAFKEAPDAVLVVAYPDTGSLILKTAYEQGFLGKKTKVLASEGMKEAKIAEQIGKNSQGEYVAAGMLGTATSAAGPAFKDFQALFTVQYKQQPKVYDPHTWDATTLLVLAAEAAKSPTSTAIRDKLREVSNPPGEVVTDVCQGLALIRAGKKVNYQGASGTVDLNPQGDVTGTYDIWTVEPDGKLKVIGKIAASGQ
ncbi:MAG: ABC transporter substrate-binding protein [Kovacikia sp.]